jgi:uncharacterized protein (DUF305 family)
LQLKQLSRIGLLATVGVLPLLAACNGSAMMNPAAPSMSGHGQGSGQGMPGMGMGMGMRTNVASELEYFAHMIPHHEEAIVAARELERGTSRPEMRAFAQSIVTTQSAEVEQMRIWLAEWYQGRDTHVNYEPMMRDLRGLSGDAIDQAFLVDMIPHHMMAVMMSQQMLSAGLARNQDVVRFAATIRDTQRQEIHMMRAWLLAWFNISPGMGH